MGKDFKTGTDLSSILGNDVLGSIASETTNKGQHEEADRTERAIRRAEMRTQGKKGCKATRVNMAFTPENHDFIKTMARITGTTMTEFVNQCIAQYRINNPEKYDEAKRMKNALLPDMEKIPE